MSTNFDWAELVIAKAGKPTTQNNIDNVARWMVAEEPPGSWYHACDPLNVNNLAEHDVESFPDLTTAAIATSAVILQSNMAPIADALAENAPLSQFSAACAVAPWSTGGYHGRPGDIAGIPVPPAVEAPGWTSPLAPAPPTPPAPAPAPPTPVPTPITQEDDMQMCAYDPVTGGIWLTDENGAIYAVDGSEYVVAANLNTHPAWLAGQEESDGANPVVGICYWGKPGEADGYALFTKPTSGVGGIPGTPYDQYRWNRDGSAA